MKKGIVTLILLILGALFTVLGMLPLIYSYPYSDGPNSGPLNDWELILMISYVAWDWYLSIGIILFLLSMFLFTRQRKVKQ